MPLVNAKCTNCGAPLTVDSSQKAAICKYCGSAYIVEEAIQNYYVTNQINADKVFVTGKGAAEKERLLKNAKTYESYKDYEKAGQIYKQVTEDYPDEYRGWLGLSLIMTDNFKKVDFKASDFDTLSGYMSRALMSVPSEEGASIRSQWDAYLSKRSVFIDAKKRDLRASESKREALDKQLQDVLKRDTAPFWFYRHDDGLTALAGVLCVFGIVILIVGYWQITSFTKTAGVICSLSIILSIILFLLVKICGAVHKSNENLTYKLNDEIAHQRIEISDIKNYL